jgi:hypothetical protein
MKRARSRRWTAHNRCCHCGLVRSSGAPTTTNAHGTTTLFAALDVKAGTIVGKCMPRHRAQEFRKFLDEIERNVPTDLDMRVVMDNASSHKTKLIRSWFAKRSRNPRKCRGFSHIGK